MNVLLRVIAEMDNVAGNVPSRIVSFPVCSAESERSLIRNAAV